MSSGSLQNRIAEKNLKENIHTKIEQNKKNYGAGSKVFGFLVVRRVFVFTNFVHRKKDGFSTKNPKTHGKRWFFNQKPKTNTWKKMVFQPKTRKKEKDGFQPKTKNTWKKLVWDQKTPKNTL